MKSFSARNTGLLLTTVFLGSILGRAQTIDVTPLFGGRFGGSVNLEEQGYPNQKARISDSFTFGAAVGVRFDADDCEKCNVIEFRYMRQNTHLNITGNMQGGLAFRTPIGMNHFLGDFTREFPIQETKDRVRAYLTATVGAASMSSPVDNRTRFVFGFGTGIKMFPRTRWGFRAGVEYLPMVMYASAQRVACVAGTCYTALGGGVMNQFEVTFGPVFRF